MATHGYAHDFEMPQGARAADIERVGQHPVLGVLWIVYGLMRVVGAALMIVYAGVATVMFGALLNRVPNPYVLMSLFHVFYAGVIILGIASGILAVLAGIAFVSSAVPARPLVLIAAAFGLPDIPLGTALGGYTLMLMLRAR